MTDKLTREQVEALTGFTPGPWSLCTHLQSKEKDEGCSCGYRGVIWGHDPDHRAICQPGHDPDPVGEEGLGPERYPRATELANAALIAAAPDLHATVTALMDEVDALTKEIAELESRVPPKRLLAYRASKELQALFSAALAAQTLRENYGWMLPATDGEGR